MAERRQEAWEEPVEATRAKLIAWGVTGDPRAALAMAAARKLATAKGGGAASLSRELRTLLDDLRAIPQVQEGTVADQGTVAAPVDPVDQVKAQREKRLLAGGE